MKIFCTYLLILLFLTCAFSQQPEPKQPEDMMNFVQDIAWSPDGKAIYFSAMRVKKDYSDFKPDKWGVYRYDFDTKLTKKLVGSAYNVTVSPDGKYIAVGKLVEGNRDIFILDADGKNPRQLTIDKADDFAPAWSPDGRTIAFNNRTDKKPEVYTINIDGTDLKRLTFSEGHRSYSPNWSPDGKYIVYYFEKGDGKDQIHVIDRDGKRSKQITNDDFNNIYPAWFSKDTIIYGQGKKGLPTKIFTINTDGSDKKQLLTLESFYARISPDGKKIAYITQKEKHIKIISLKGEEIETIVPEI